MSSKLKIVDLILPKIVILLFCFVFWALNYKWNQERYQQKEKTKGQILINDAKISSSIQLEISSPNI